MTKADSGYYQSGTCRLSIPEEFCSSNVQFAFHYGKDWGSSAETVAVDNIRLEEEAACVHSHTEVRNEKEATCTEPGYTGDTYCADCGMLLEEGAETPALGHDFSRKLETVPPTCTERGYTRYQCSRCSVTEDRDLVDAAGTPVHKGRDPPTCTEGGYTTYTCTVCGDTYTDDRTEPLGHDFHDTVIAPSCGRDG